jgi:nicotinate-nucleotide pyrophosphorylase (carboxylating)
VLTRVFYLVDPRVQVKPVINEGDAVKKGDIIATIEGPSRSILSGERVALNLIQHMSGIATATSKAVEAVRGTAARITDTRKTTPGLRVLEKYAVKAGGGANHRFNLADGVLIKDNHIKAAGGITEAVTMTRGNIPHTLKIEVETETMEQVREAVAAGADIIMLDNMTNEQMAEAVKYIDGRAQTEASGNMGERDLLSVAKTGVDIISIGSLTHTVKALDISLKF